MRPFNFVETGHYQVTLSVTDSGYNTTTVNWSFAINGLF